MQLFLNIFEMSPPLFGTQTLVYFLLNKYKWATQKISDDAFSTGTGLERAGFAGPVRWLWALDSSAKTRNKKGLAGACPLPPRCLSQFFPRKEKINCLENKVLVHKSAYLSLMG